MQVVAILDFRAAVTLQDNRRFLEEMAAAGKVRPGDWRTGAYRSLTVLADGTCLLRRSSAGVLSRRTQAGVQGGRQQRVRSAK